MPSRVGALHLPLATAFVTLTALAGSNEQSVGWPPAGPSYPREPSVGQGVHDRPEVRVVDEMTFEGAASNGNIRFFAAADIDVTSGGDIVVADPHAGQLVVLSAAGGILARVSQRGSGPGEFEDDRPRRVAATTSFIVADASRGALNVFRASDRSFYMAIPLEDGASLRDIVPVDDTVLVLAARRNADRRCMTVTRVDLATGVQQDILRHPMQPLATMVISARSGPSFPTDAPGAGTTFRAASDGRVFALADPLRYLAAAFLPDGKTIWSLDVPGTRLPLTPSFRDEIVNRMRGMDARRSTRWSDTIRFLEDERPAILDIQYDGIGRLFIYRTPREDADTLEVDVYDPGGELTVAALMLRSPNSFWQAALADKVYSIRIGPDGEDIIVVASLRLP